MRLVDFQELLENSHTIDDLSIYDSGYLAWVAHVLTNIVTKIDELESRRKKISKIKKESNLNDSN